jgi:PleD family two-component response regulator
MSNQITVTLGRNDRELTEFLLEKEGLKNADELTGVNIRNQLYELMRSVKSEAI